MLLVFYIRSLFCCFGARVRLGCVCVNSVVCIALGYRRYMCGVLDLVGLLVGDWFGCYCFVLLYWCVACW